mgnify:CR=1 FL=1|jgi:hypothetical protein
MSTWILLAFLSPFPWKVITHHPTNKACEAHRVQLVGIKTICLLREDRNFI